MYFGSVKILEVDYNKQEKDNLIYQWNRQMDFNEWYDDVYIVSNNDSGSHTIKELWNLFEKWEDNQEIKS
jgi:hypothetical protein